MRRVLRPLKNVSYEWKPDLCSKSKRVGHNTEVCKVPTKNVWVAKPSVVANVDEEGF